MYISYNLIVQDDICHPSISPQQINTVNAGIQIGRQVCRCTCALRLGIDNSVAIVRELSSSVIFLKLSVAI